MTKGRTVGWWVLIGVCVVLAACAASQPRPDTYIVLEAQGFG